MEIYLNKLEENKIYNQKFLVKESVELVDLNCLGEIHLRFKVIFGGEHKLIEGVFKGVIQTACRYCNENLEMNYSLPFKILLEFKYKNHKNEKKAVVWDDNVDQIDNYCVSVRFNKPKLSIISIIREQILLHLNPDMSSEYTQESICTQCKDHSPDFLEKNTQSPWDELNKIKFEL